MVKKRISQDPVPRSIHPMFKNRLCYTLSKTGVFVRGMLEQSLKKYKLMPPQAGILYILSGYEEYNQNLLGQEMSIDKASMVKFIDGLEKLGYVKRMIDPKDRRAKLLRITPKGLTVQKKIASLHEKLEEEILKDFTDEEVVILKKFMPRVLERILELMHSV